MELRNSCSFVVSSTDVRCPPHYGVGVTSQPYVTCHAFNGDTVLWSLLIVQLCHHMAGEHGRVHVYHIIWRTLHCKCIDPRRFEYITQRIQNGPTNKWVCHAMRTKSDLLISLHKGSRSHKRRLRLWTPFISYCFYVFTNQPFR